MELEIGMWGYLWGRMGPHGWGWARCGPCGWGMMVHGAWHCYMGVREGLCCIFSSYGGSSWSWKLVRGGICGYVWVHMGGDGHSGVFVAGE
jgi:hypothetical protein